MLKLDCHLLCTLRDSFRIRQVAGMFDLPIGATTGAHVRAQVPGLDEPWEIGMIVGPSGSGKSAIAKAAYRANLVQPSRWPRDVAIVDAMGDGPIHRITHTLTCVGLGSPRTWVKPYAVLSNGEKFRCDLAWALLKAMRDIARDGDSASPSPGTPVEGRGGGRSIAHLPQQAPSLSLPPAYRGEGKWAGVLERASPEAEDPNALSRLPLVVMDEYTSVVSRAIARVASAALSRAIRSKQIPMRFIAVTCHEDVIPWLRPDWVLRMQPGGAEGQTDLKSQISNLKSEISDPSLDSFLGILTWGRPGRPKIDLDIRRVSRDLWPLFRRHHYLSGSLHPAAQCFAAYFENEPAAFCAALPFPHPRRPGWREHRLVCLPDFQGIGIGTKLSETVARMYVSTGRPYFSTTSHPGIIRHRAASHLWRIIRSPGMVSPVSHSEAKRTGMAQSCSIGRITASFEYIGPGEERIIHHGDTEARRSGSA